MPPKASPTRALNEGVPLPRSPPNPTTQPTSDVTNNARRRRPRKLNRPANASTNSTVEANGTVAVPALNNEISALKSRMKDLESQVQTLYQLSTTSQDPSPATSTNTITTSSNTTSSNPHRSPRRRGRTKSSQSAQAKAELARLEAELQATQTQLARLRNVRTPRKLDSETDADTIEEIPRTADPAVDDAAASGRAVTLSGSYRIPLPSAVSVEDVQAIQRGVRSAGEVARGLIDASRSSGLMRDPAAGKGKGPVDGGAGAVAAAGEEKKNWSEWFGVYSVAISRLVNSIEAEAAIEQRPVGAGEGKRPTAGRRSTAPVKGVTFSAQDPESANQGKGKERAPATKGQGQQGKGSAQRPSLKSRGSNTPKGVSSEQIQTLMA